MKSVRNCLKPSVSIRCPRCSRTRNVSQRSVVASMADVDTENAKRWRECKTCKLLRSIDQHRAAITHLESIVSKRRWRGL